jgi:N-acetylmuramic acid 6-phosphate etherase
MQNADDINPVVSSSGGAASASTEDVSARYEGFDTWDSEKALDALWQGQQSAVASVRPAIPVLAKAAEAVASRLGAGAGRLVYTGAGSSGLLAMQDGMEMTQTFSWPAERLVLLMAGGDAARLQQVGLEEDDASAAEADAARVAFTSEDVLVAVAASGTTPYTLAMVSTARAAGALTIAIINNQTTPMGAAADHEIVLASGPEVIAGSTRLGAGTAQKAALGMLSTLVMTRLGNVFDGYMVSVVADNQKLRERALRMVGDIADVAEEAARVALDTCDGQVKNAVLIARGMSADEAEVALAGAGGDLRSALNLTTTKKS